MKRITYSRVELLVVLAMVGILAAAALSLGAGWVDLSAASVGSGLMLANAGALELKQVEAAIEKATAGVKATTDRMQQALDQALSETKRLETVTGKTNEELVKAMTLATESQTSLKGAMDRLLEVEQKIAKRAGAAGPETFKTWGEMVTGSEQFKNVKGRDGKGKPEMEAVEVGSWHKTRITSADVQSSSAINSMVPAERVGFVSPAERQLMVRRLLPVYPTESNMVEYWKENVFTNSAAPQGAGSSPAETEFQIKAESAITFTLVQVGMTTIAHWIPASRQVLSDAKMLGAYIDQRLRYGVLFEEEDEVLNSTGQNGELNGLVNQATAYNRRATADSRLDTLLKAFLQVTLSDFTADGVVMSNIDWTALLLLKDTTGRYIFGNPSAQQAEPNVWGRPCIPTNSLTTGKFLTGAFQLATALWDREQATVRIAEQHADFFVRNAVVILAEERVALTVYRPTALVSGDFGADAGQPG